MLKSLAIAVSMYSRIPVPNFSWDDKSAKYALCYFPFVGLIIGIAEFAAFFLLSYIETNILKLCIMCTVPLIISGGIHMDGFMDTVDALSSYSDKERKLEILKDPNTGAFAVIAFGVYMLLYIGLLSELKSGVIIIFCLGFVLSRALSGIYVLSFDKAKNGGLAAQWSGFTDKKKAVAALSVQTFLCIAVMLFFDMITGIIVILITVVTSIYHYNNCKKNFGGITGDLAGYFLQLEEIAVLLSCIIGGNI